MSWAGVLTVDGVDLNYRVQGDGRQPLVCIHGVGSYMEAWKEVVDRLDTKFRVLTFDLRGHGRSSRVKRRYEIDEIAREVLVLCDHIGFDRFHLAGFSLGGLIAQQIAIHHPERVDRLVLLSTVAGRTEEEKRRVADRLAALQAGEPGSHYDASLSRWLTEDFQARNPEKIAYLRKRNAENDPDCYASAYRVLAETDLGTELHRITAPTLIATGADDAGSNPRMAAFMKARIPRSRLEIFPGLRHSILTEAPQIVANTMDTFLTSEDPIDG